MKTYLNFRCVTLQRNTLDRHYMKSLPFDLKTSFGNEIQQMYFSTIYYNCPLDFHLVTKNCQLAPVIATVGDFLFYCFFSALNVFVFLYYSKKITGACYEKTIEGGNDCFILMECSITHFRKNVCK